MSIASIVEGSDIDRTLRYMGSDEEKSTDTYNGGGDGYRFETLRGLLLLAAALRGRLHVRRLQRWAACPNKRSK
jgi:hypothetical protein